MKKQVALLTTALLATSFVLGATSCASKDVSKIAPEAKTVKTTATAITAIDFKKEVSHSAVDNTGLVVSTVATRPAATEEVPNPVVTSYTHKLFDMKANAYVSGVEVVAKASVGDEDSSEIRYNEGNQKETNVIQKLNDGLYYVKKTEWKRMKGNNDQWLPFAQGDTRYDIYSRSGVVASNVEGNITGNMFTQNNGTRIYVNFKGEVVKEEDPLAKILVWGNEPKEVGEYLFYEENVYTKDGEYVRKFNPTYEFNLSASEQPMAMWSVGSKYFMQTLTLLPENAKKYDVVTPSRITLDGDLGNMDLWLDGQNADGAQKYNVNTYSYDVDKEKVKEVDFDYFVYDGDSYGNKDVAILLCAEIVDKEISQVACAQAFNEKGKVAVDLQKLAPGASDYTYYTDYAVLTNEYTGLQTVVKGKEVVGTFVAGTVSYKNNIVYKNNPEAKNLYLYNLDGTLKKTIHYTYFEELDNGNFYYQTKDSVCVYDTMSNTEKTIFAIDDNDSFSKVATNDAYLVVTNLKENEKTVYFLMTDTATVSVDTEKFDMSVETVVAYNNYNGNLGWMVKIETISKAPETLETNYANRTIATTYVSVEKK